MIVSAMQCVECGRWFDMTDASQAEEFHFGHDCEEGGGNDEVGPSRAKVG